LRLINFLKIARLSKVVEQSQKIKREDLKFLTNIFVKTASSSNTKLKISKALNQSRLDQKQANEKPKKKLARFNSKFWERKKPLNKYKRGNDEISKNENSFMKESKIKSKLNNTNHNKSPNKKNTNRLSSKDRNLNDASIDSYKYDKIFNPKIYEGKTINYDELSRTFTFNHNRSIDFILFIIYYILKSFTIF